MKAETIGSAINQLIPLSAGGYLSWFYPKRLLQLEAAGKLTAPQVQSKQWVAKVGYALLALVVLQAFA